MKKKIFAVVATVAIIASFAGCSLNGSVGTSPSPTHTPSGTTTPTHNPTTTPSATPDDNDGGLNIEGDLDIGIGDKDDGKVSPPPANNNANR